MYVENVDKTKFDMIILCNYSCVIATDVIVIDKLWTNSQSIQCVYSVAIDIIYTSILCICRPGHKNGFPK